MTTFEGQEGREAWNDPAQQPPGHLGLSAIIPHPEERDRFWIIVQGFSLFETTDGGKTWTPRNKGLRRDWPADYEEIGFCVHKVSPAADFERMYQQNHVGMHRSDDAGQTWTEITEGLPTEFGFAAATHPHDRDTFYVIPLDPGQGRTMPDGHAAVWRTRDAGSSWQRLDNGLPTEDAYVGVLREGMAIDDQDDAGPLLRHQHRPAVREHRRGRELEPGRRALPGHHVGHRRNRRVMAELHLPPVLLPLFPGLPRELAVEAGTVLEAIDRLDERWPGLPRPPRRGGPGAAPAHQRLRRPRARRARDRARDRLASRRDRRDQRRLTRAAAWDRTNNSFWVRRSAQQRPHTPSTARTTRRLRWDWALERAPRGSSARPRRGNRQANGHAGLAWRRSGSRSSLTRRCWPSCGARCHCPRLAG